MDINPFVQIFIQALIISPLNKNIRKACSIHGRDEKSNCYPTNNNNNNNKIIQLKTAFKADNRDFFSFPQ